MNAGQTEHLYAQRPIWLPSLDSPRLRSEQAHSATLGASSQGSHAAPTIPQQTQCKYYNLVFL